VNVIDLAGLADPQRLGRLHRLNLLDAAPRPNLDRLVRLACGLLEARIGPVSLIDTDRQFFLAAHGLPEPLATVRQTSLDYSLCQYPAATGRPLIVGDLQKHPLLAGNPAVTEIGVRAYAGIPMIDRQGYPFGTCCVIDLTERDWDDGQLATLARLADTATDICLSALRESRFEEARYVASATPSKPPPAWP
jgi:GAF domain-containing protein